MMPTDNVQSKPEIIMLPNKVAAGFPSPGEDLAGAGIDLNDFLITNPAATFLVRVTGDSMIDAGIFEDDVLVVDRSRNAHAHSLVIAVVDGDFTVKKYTREKDTYFLTPANPKYPKLPITEGVSIWGVVVSMMRKF